MGDVGEITELLGQVDSGHRGAFDRLLTLVYTELKRIADRNLRGERLTHSLQTTGLVHEAYLKLVDRSNLGSQNRAHFYAAASRAMRQILIDHARAARRQKRGGGWQRQPLDDASPPPSVSPIDLLALDEAMSKLADEDERKARMVELRYFGGLSEDETANALGVSARTVRRDWKYAQAWLAAELRLYGTDLAMQ